MHQNLFRTRWESLQRSHRPLAVFKGPTSEGKGKRGGKGKGKGRERGGGRGREGRGGENDLTHPLLQIPGYATAGS